MKKYNQCSKPIFGRTLDRLDWILNGQSKAYPKTPYYTNPVLTCYVRQKIIRVIDCSNDMETRQDSDYNAS